MAEQQVCGVLFDFDGTLTAPGGLDFARIRAALGCPDNETILEFIWSLAPEGQTEAYRILERFEEDAALSAAPNQGAETLLAFLKREGIPFGVITRNRLDMVLLSLRNFASVSPEDFSVILTRDDAVTPKPAPDGILLAARRMGIPVERLIVVGDFRYDIEAGRRAGAVTAFLENGQRPEDTTCSPDYRVSTLDELQRLIERLAGAK